MKYKITYNIPFSPDHEVREKVFEEVVTSGDPKSARQIIYRKQPHANILSLVQTGLT